MWLVYLPVNMAWAFLFGNDPETAQVIDLEGFSRFHESREAAVKAAAVRGLRVARSGAVEAA